MNIELIKYLKEVLDEKEIEKLFDCFNYPPFSSLRINTNKISISNFDRLFALEKHPYVTEGRIYDKTLFPMGKHPFHNAGLYYIQEPSAMMVGQLLPIIKGDKVLDLCAAPGGKSTHILSKLNNTGLLYSNDISSTRVKALSENIERWGAHNCIVTCASPSYYSDNYTGYFDKVILDAPCSGLGMWRKNELVANDWSKEKVEKLVPLQKELIIQAYKCLKKAGILIYSTCTFTKEENEEVVSYLLQNTNASIIPIKMNEGMKEGLLHGTIRLYPYLFKGEGQFMALIKCNDNNEEKKHRVQQSLSDNSLKLYRSWEKDTLNIKLSGTFVSWKNNIHYINTSIPSLDGLKVERLGIHLGEIIKDRFVPSHSLVMALKKEDIKQVFSIDTKDIKITNYLKGLTLESEFEKGYVAVFINDYPLGWSKSTQGILKNLYPKGLRLTC